ncbi:hypothetical protein P280DRAFT_510130 [Massarina eburnea CBS 473.64]|uniref:Uncharacterized protein n=1 Tax=Massarina eburnea CBS 473.64 TaxID=1395130 RepID=A0A6A6RMA7_9PLEO|nr:hypothetical protein P280DRAFT_510130 [Massarina eburnea CBS 473.64]
MAGNTPTTVSAAIWIYKGAFGLDWSERRHTLLALNFADGSKPTIVQTAGSTRDYRVDKVDDYRPEISDNVVGNVNLGALLVEISKDELVSFLLKTPVDNTIDDWNSHHWVAEAMERMVQAGYLTRETLDRGTDEMADIIVDAKDEHLR